MKQTTLRLTFLLILLVCGKVSAQKIFFKVESGYLTYLSRTFKYSRAVDLNNENTVPQLNAFDINAMAGIGIKQRSSFALGAGYLNQEGKSGLSLFANYELSILTKQVSPIVGMKAGISHSEKTNADNYSRTTELVEMNVGVKVKLKNRIACNLSSGLLYTQYRLFLPIRAGFYF